MTRTNHQAHILAGLFVVAAVGDVKAQTNLTADIGPAVSVGWPTEDGKMYQVQTSQDLDIWNPLGPVLVGTGLHNTSYFPAGDPAAFYQIKELAGTATNRIVGLRSFLTGSSSIQPVGNSLDLSNIRVEAAGITLDDLVNARFVFDPINQLFRLSSYDVSSGVGVYREPYFAKDNTNALTMGCGTNVLQPGVNCNVSEVPAAGIQFYADLTVGHAPVLWFDNITVPVYLRVHGPSGVTNELILPDTTTFVYSTPWPALAAGRYYFDIVPVSSAPASFIFKFGNANPNLLGTLVHNTPVSVSLNFNHQYAKYRVNLTANQILSLSKPSSRTIRFTMLNALSEKAVSFVGLALNFRAPTTGVYYVFIDDANGTAGAGYSGMATISN